MTLKTFEESFRKYEHPFEYILDIIKQLRSMKSDFNLSSKSIENAYVNIRNSELELSLVLESGFNIARLCQVDNLYVTYVDDDQQDNNLVAKFDKNKQLTIFYK